MDGDLNRTSSDYVSEIEKPLEDEPLNISGWLNRIECAKRKESNWRTEAKRCFKIYRASGRFGDDGSYDSSGDYDDIIFNILYSNTETLVPALFSNAPKPDVRNQYLTKDQTARDAATVIERALILSMEQYSFVKRIKTIVKDYCLTGRGVARLSLWPVKKKQKFETITPDGRIVLKEEEVVYAQSAEVEVVQWDSITIDPVKQWEDIKWMAFETNLSEKEYKEYFPGMALSGISDDRNEYDTEKKYKIYEVWDKDKKKVYFLAKGFDKPLKTMDDPYELMHFFPIPEPIYSIRTSTSLVPVPEYSIYEYLANELDEVSWRIKDLIRSCRLIGIYDSSVMKVGDLLDARDTTFIPVDSNILAKGGIKSLLDVVDVSYIAKVLSQLYLERDQIKSVIYEVTGISDIIRGESQASETATAQDIKARYAGLRLRDRRDDINRFIVDIIRMKAELICNFYPIEQLSQMSGIDIKPEVQQLLNSDVLRTYRIDIETDSTLSVDMDREMKRRADIVSAITQFLRMASPLVAQGALPLETAKSLLNYALQPSKISSELQDAIDLIGTSAPPQMMSQRPPGGPPMSPEQGAADVPGNGMPSEQSLPQETLPYEQA